ncbi:MAG: ABC transporter permease [Oscillospiraceae bacterium]|nr:ABC transporter permease [Oscillospiraceae bacterium]
MFKFIVKRLLLSLMILFFVLFIIYGLMYSLPASYPEKRAREMSQKAGQTKSYEELLSEMNERLGMDKTLVQGYFHWIGTAVQGDFGDSWTWTKPCTKVFTEKIWYSFSLNVIVFFFEILLAIPLGILAARKQYSLIDYSVTVFALVGISLPSFFVATCLKMIFSGVLPMYGTVTANAALTMTEFEQFIDMAKHFILPSLTLIVVGMGDLMRYTRTNTLEVLNSDYIRTARSKGLPERRVMNYHAFRNTLIPIVTIIGNMLPGLFSGAMITEQLFSFQGIGQASFTSMMGGDIPFTMFYLAFSTVLTLLGTLLADILYAVVDPRVRVN